MYKIPIKEKDRPELKYLCGEIGHLEKMGASKADIAAAINNLGIRLRVLYPEVNGKRTEIDGGGENFLVYESKEEWLMAITADANDKYIATPRN